jgi:hypothetical protein
VASGFSRTFVPGPCSGERIPDPGVYHAGGMYNPPMFKRIVLVLMAAALAGCSSRNVQTDLEVVDVNTGWYDLGVVAAGQDQGKHKVVPAVSFRLKNISAEAISGVQIDAVFRHVGKEEVVDEHYVPGVPSNMSLEPGATTGPIVLRSKWGNAGEEPRDLLFKNSHFVDFEVTILGRHGRNNWASMGRIPIERTLLKE